MSEMEPKTERATSEGVGCSALFDLPESLSPRLKWMRDEGIIVHHAEYAPEPWCAWHPDNTYDEFREGLPKDPEECGYGMTKIEAVENLAALRGVVNWSNTPVSQPGEGSENLSGRQSGLAGMDC